MLFQFVAKVSHILLHFSLKLGVVKVKIINSVALFCLASDVVAKLPVVTVVHFALFEANHITVQLAFL
jgi:fumarate reductase subunit D